MKALILCALLSLSPLFASTTHARDSFADTLHQRMVEREPHFYAEATFQKVSEVPEDIAAIQMGTVLELVDFASELDLFALGFFYELNANMYEVVLQNEVIGYTYSINILKNDVLRTRRFYILNRRVDGVFYVGRIVNYDTF